MRARRSLRAIRFVVFAWVAALCRQGAAAAAAAPRPVITRFAQLQQLPEAEAARPQFVDLQCDVVHVDESWDMAWVQTSLGLQYLSMPDGSPPLRAGERVRLTGDVVPALGPDLKRLAVEIVGPAEPAPWPELASLQPAKRDRAHGVQLSARVTGQQQVNETHWLLTLQMAEGAATAWVVGAPNALSADLRDADVTVRGIFNPKRDSANRLTGEYEILVADPRDLTVTAWPARGARGSEPGQANQRVFTRYNDFWQVLPHEQLEQAHRADIEFDVVLFDPVWRMMWLETDGTLQYVGLDGEPPAVRPGQRVRARGLIVPNEGPSTRRLEFTVIGATSGLKWPRFENLTDRERQQAQRVLLGGIVNRQQLTDENHLFLEIAHRGTVVGARLYLPTGSPVPALAGAVVDVRCLYNLKGDVAHRAIGYEFLVAAPEYVQVLAWLATDPAFDRAAVPIASLAQAPRGELARIVGEVRAQTPGHSITVRDETGQIEIRTGQTEPIGLGDVVEVIGTPEPAPIAWSLGEARYRRSGDARKPLEPLGLAQLRLVDQVLRLTAAEADRAFPVQLAGVVTWSDPATNQFYLLDGTGGIRVLTGTAVATPVPGQTVGIRGRSRMGSFAPEVLAEAAQHLADGTLPVARDITLEQAFTGIEEGQWVALHGYVRAVEAVGSWTRLELATSSGTAFAFAPADPELAGLAGAIVRVRGVCTAVANERRQLTGIRLWMTSSRDVQVEEAAPQDPFALPAGTLADLRRFKTFQTLNRRVRLAGVVVHHVPGRYVVMQEGQDALVALSRDTTPLHPGDRVEVAGLAGSTLNSLVLREARYRKTGAGPPPEPITLARIAPVEPTLEGRLIRVEARLLQVNAGPHEHHLVLDAGGTLFEARIDAGEDLANRWQPHSRLALTGIYGLSQDEYGQPRALVLQLRRPEDVVVLEQASWLTLERAMVALGLLAAIIAAGLGWVLSLRRRVRAQTAQLRLQLTKESELRARQHNLMESASDLVCTTDLAGNITAFNPAGESLTGYTRAEALTMNLRDLMAGETTELLAPGGTVRASAAGTGLETQFRTRDGRLKWVEISARELREEGRASGVLAIVRDISGRKEFQERLAAARDAAEASARAKGAFLAAMSHEIRTPMNGVIGMSNLLLETALSEEQRDFTETIRDSAEALLVVLNDVLDFSKIEAGKLEFEHATFDPAELVEGTLELLATRAAVKRLEFASFIPADVPAALRGDAGRLRQVLLNLVGNAIKFTERGEVLTTVSVVEQTAEWVRLRFEIADTGIGLSEEEQSRLFLPFSQADSSTTRRFGGTGLGLAICKQIVEMMDGSVHVESTKGSGSRFWFTARFERGLASVIPQTADQPRETLAGRRVLAVDDNATNRRIVDSYVRAAGMVCTVAASGAEALRCARAAVEAGEPFAFALLDYQMPEMDGVALASALTGGDLAPSPQVLLLTSLDRRFSPHEAAVAGIARVLNKPIRRSELLEAMRRLLPSSADRASPVRNAVAASSARSAAAPSGVRALIVEDNVVNQRVARLLLERVGVRTELAANGIEALEAIERMPFDFVLMDCQMPEMDGYEATRRIRANPRHGRLRIIAMTANAMQGDRERCLEAGMDDYVSKPMRPVELAAALERCQIALVARPAA